MVQKVIEDIRGKIVVKVEIPEGARGGDTLEVTINLEGPVLGALAEKLERPRRVRGRRLWQAEA